MLHCKERWPSSKVPNKSLKRTRKPRRLAQTLYAKTMNNILRKNLLILPFVYIASWIAAYVVINQDFNTKYMWDYFVLAWTFNGFIRPSVIWMLSIASTIVIMVIVVRRSRGSSKEFE